MSGTTGQDPAGVATAPPTREEVLRHLKEMLRIRQFEDRCVALYQDQKIHGFLHLCNGEEAIAVGAMQALEPRDAIVTTYREHGHALARGITMGSVMAELYGKQTGTSGGRGGSMHIFSKAAHFYGGNAIVGAGLPMAVGLALADRMQQRDAITACFFGEGAMAEGEFHESINLAALWRLPVLFLCENNLYAMGTALVRSQSQIDLHLKAAAYGVPSQAVDGMDVFAVRAAVREAAATIRAGEGPRFLELRTYRLRAHSMFDAQQYRDRAEVEAWRQRGPIITFTQKFKAAGLMTEEDFKQLELEADREVDAAVAFAESSAWEPVETLTRHLYKESAAP
jgi:pyruvate dehydrogenase E1 component alpha subunit